MQNSDYSCTSIQILWALHKGYTKEITTHCGRKSMKPYIDIAEKSKEE